MSVSAAEGRSSPRRLARRQVRVMAQRRAARRRTIVARGSGRRAAQPCRHARLRRQSNR